MAGSLKAFFVAIAKLAEVVPLFILNRVENEIDRIDDKILALSVDATPHDLLRIEQLGVRKERKAKLVRALRSSVGQTD
jgi:hypothetical protein